MQLILAIHADICRRLYSFRLCNFYAILTLSVCGVASDITQSFANNVVFPSQSGFVLVLSKATDIVLPSGAASVVIGNPEIADILVQTGTSLTISGKRVGQTNMLVRDQENRLLVDLQLDVVPPDTASLTVYRGADKTDYDCRPLCRTDDLPDMNRKAAPSVNSAQTSP